MADATRAERTIAKLRGVAEPTRHAAVLIPGNGRPCDGCGDTMHPTETSTRVIIRDSADWRLHEECYRAWAGIKH